MGEDASLRARAEFGENSFDDRLAGLVECVVVDFFRRPSDAVEEATDLWRRVHREREQLFRLRREVPVDGCPAEGPMLGECFVLQRQDARATG